MDIDGFGSETIERLLDKNIIKNFDDIYKIKLSQLVDLDRMAQSQLKILLMP